MRRARAPLPQVEQAKTRRSRPAGQFPPGVPTQRPDAASPGIPPRMSKRSEPARAGAQNCLSVPWKVHTYFFRKKGRKQPRRGSTRIGGGRCEEMKGYSPENCELSTKNWFFGQNQSPVFSCQFLVAHLATETHSELAGLTPPEGRASPGNGHPILRTPPLLPPCRLQQ